MAGGRP